MSITSVSQPSTSVLVTRFVSVGCTYWHEYAVRFMIFFVSSVGYSVESTKLKIAITKIVTKSKNLSN